ncbi:Hypothetical predicted protein [Mytilus galloprovincialis]|uniref:Uncharacterized protein n=1 Tax=Mytilus galloprovincialis TaxID=29158 RepID=A0A8B6DGT0_MYTGA|nr:Hypothetical predicted protein [Mytilus galloprovincialis]
MEMRLANNVKSSTLDIKQHITEQTSFAATQAEHALSEKIQNTGSKVESCIKHEVEEVRESQANNFQELGNKIQETMTDISMIKEVTKNQEKTQGKDFMWGNWSAKREQMTFCMNIDNPMQFKLREILKTIQKLKLFVKYEIPANSNILVPEGPEETCTDSQESPVLWQFSTPKNWNLEQVEATLRNPLNKDEHFKKKFVRKGSLIMLTTIATSILRDGEAFETAVMSFITKMIKDCDINTEIPGQVDVTLHILNVNEVSLSCEVPPEVRPFKVTGNTKHLIENEKFDVAFLNGDDEKEIGWVNNMSRTLKTRYDIKCSILAQDFLNGFPLKRVLSMYVNMFQAVILTLTKENHQQYDFYIKDDMPVIAVELDYLSEIRLNLRSFPYINCTTCEHLWFPHLLNTLKMKKIPGK